MYCAARSPDVETMRTRLFSGAVCATCVARVDVLAVLTPFAPMASKGVGLDVAECVPAGLVVDGVSDRVSLLMYDRACVRAPAIKVVVLGPDPALKSEAVVEERRSRRLASSSCSTRANGRYLLALPLRLSCCADVEFLSAAVLGYSQCVRFVCDAMTATRFVLLKARWALRNIRSCEMAVESDRCGDSSDQACGFVSRTRMRSEGGAAGRGRISQIGPSPV